MSAERIEKAKAWLEFWGAVLPDVMDAVQALFRKSGGDVNASRGELRKLKDHWGDTDAENDAFRERLAAVEDEDAPASVPEPKVTESYPEVLEAPPDNDPDQPR